MRFLVYLGADDLVGKVGHGVGQPALQAFGKVTDGLSERAWKSFKVCFEGGKNTEIGFIQCLSKLHKLHFLFAFSRGCHL